MPVNVVNTLESHRLLPSHPVISLAVVITLLILLDVVITGKVTDEADFRAKLVTAWFTFYKRSSPQDTSGFEHVFLGEYKSGNKVNGFHSWVQFYLKEQAGEANYRGYVKEDPVSIILTRFAGVVTCPTTVKLNCIPFILYFNFVLALHKITICSY